MQDLLSAEYEDLGLAELMQVIERLVPIEGLTLLDIGCGGGLLGRELATRRGEVVGVEPDPIQAEKNRRADPLPGLRFIEAGAEKLPFDDRSVDGVFFRYSLHHVPGELLDPALREVARVLKRNGYLCVIEPLLAGTMQAVYMPFHDETRVRTRAFAALNQTAKPLFAESREYRYGEMVRYDSFEAFRDRMLGQTYNSIERERLDNAEVRALFELGRSEDGYVFDRYNRVNLFKGVIG